MKKVNYCSNKRTSELVSITATRYTVNDKPTCFSWAGDDEHESEICSFLLTKSFGMKFVCGLNGADLYHYNNDSTQLIKPDKGCPLWERSIASGLTEPTAK